MVPAWPGPGPGPGPGTAARIADPGDSAAGEGYMGASGGGRLGDMPSAAGDLPAGRDRGPDPAGRASAEGTMRASLATGTFRPGPARFWGTERHPGADQIDYMLDVV
jgi:hypothetical protein